MALEVARGLGAPLGVCVVRKLGVPGHEELAMGAIASGGVRVLNDHVVSALGLTEASIQSVTAIERTELERRERLYARYSRLIPADVDVVVLVDDGLATGATMRAAAASIQRSFAGARLVVAVPVASRQAIDSVEPLVEEVIALQTPEPFYAVGSWYREFSQVSDDDVCAMLAARTRELDEGRAA